MPILKDIIGYADSITLEVADSITEFIDDELKMLLEDCETIYDHVSARHIVKLDASKHPKNGAYQKLMSKILDEEIEEVNQEMEGWHGGYYSKTDASDSYDAISNAPVVPQEIDCNICKGTGKDKRNIIQKPCEKCEGTGKILEEIE